MTQLNKIFAFTLIFGLLFGGIGAFLSLSAINEAKSHAAIEARATSKSVDATVVRVDTRKDVSTRDGKRTVKYLYTPNYEFTDDKGAIQKIEGDTVTRNNTKSPIDVGDTQKVIYDSANPQDSFVDDGDSSPVIGYVFIGFGVLIAGLGIFKKIKG